MAHFRDIPQFTADGSYQVNVMLEDVPRMIDRYREQGLIMCPDFQRGHVWTEAQQVAFIEYLLRGGKTSRLIHFNHPGWHGSAKGPFVLVDGLQRITAIMRFIDNEIPAFGHPFNEYEDKLPALTGPDLVFKVNDLKTRTEVLTWYLEMNSGGTPHTSEELARVKALLEAETGASK